MGLVRDKDYYVEVITGKFKDEGVTVSPAMISNVLDKYLESKIESLEAGDSVEEKGIGTINPSWRRVSDAFTDRGYTSKIKVTIDKELKSKLNDRLASSPEFRKAVGASEL